LAAGVGFEFLDVAAVRATFIGWQAC